MKLKNKKTGEIGYPYFQNWKEISCVIVDENAKQIAEYTSLAKLNEEWEDYEEPKEFWYISDFGFILKYEITERTVKSTIEEMKSIGNYFETKEEAEKAVEKLKAWKRLKDKGYKLGMDLSDVYGTKMIYGIKITASEYNEVDDETRADLDLLFGGEE